MKRSHDIYANLMHMQKERLKTLYSKVFKRSFFPVVNKEGRIAPGDIFKGEEKQRQLLEKKGITFIL